jgi:hypothetical protein
MYHILLICLYLISVSIFIFYFYYANLRNKHFYEPWQTHSTYSMLHFRFSRRFQDKISCDYNNPSYPTSLCNIDS